MNQLQVFQHPNFGQVRTIDCEGKVLFVGVDVARALDYAKPSQAVIDHCKGIRKLGIPSQGGVQETNVIPEGDLYRLIVKAADQSRNPDIKAKAEEYEKWIFDDVLPSIRKTGQYSIGVPSYMIDDPIARAQQWIEEQKAKQALETKTLMLEQRVAEYEPQIGYLDKILQSKGTMTITQIAKDYGMSGQALNQILHEEKVQYKQNKQWLLYRQYHDKGYTKSETIDIRRSNGDPDVTLNTRWTQKGRLFIHEILKRRDIVPVMDRVKVAN